MRGNLPRIGFLFLLSLFFWGLSMNASMAEDLYSGCKKVRLEVTDDAVYLKAKCRYGFAGAWSQNNKIDLNKYIKNDVKGEQFEADFGWGGSGFVDTCKDIKLDKFRGWHLNAQCCFVKYETGNKKCISWKDRRLSLEAVKVKYFSGDFEIDPD